MRLLGCRNRPERAEDSNFGHHQDSENSMGVRFHYFNLAIFAFFVHPDFWGSISVAFVFHFFRIYIFFYVFQTEAAARPHNSNQILDSNSCLDLAEFFS